MTPKKASSKGKIRERKSKASRFAEDLGWLEETAEEAEAYDQRVKDEIQWKLTWTKPGDDGPVPQTSSPPSEPAQKSSDVVSRPSSEAELTLRNSSEPLDYDHDPNEDGDEGQEITQSAMMEFSMPSFRPSHIVHSTPQQKQRFHELPTPSLASNPAVPRATPDTEQCVAGTSGTPRPTNTASTGFSIPSFRPSHIAHSTPKPISTSTFPNIPTPSFDSTPELPKPNPATEHPVAGPSRTPRPVKTTATFVDTPTHISSPIDTPPTSRQGPMIGEGRGRRDDPATPVPLGVEKFQFLKSKKDFQTLTKHFEMFTKQSERMKKAALDPPKGRDKGKLGKTSEVLGGKVFEGLRFCFPPELGNTSKQKTHWDIIAKRGGQVTLQPDTAVTHVIYDSGRSAQILARQLGLQTLSELPEGTVCVRYDWVVHCLRAGRLVETGPYLSFPKNVFTRASTSTIPGRGNSRMTDITDLLRGKTTSISRKRMPTASDSDTESPAKSTRPPKAIHAELSRISGIKKHKSDWTKSAIPTVHTEHEAPGGPGWIDVPAEERDGLDDMITGLKNGSVPEEEQIEAEDEEDDIARPSSALGGEEVKEGNPRRVASGFKCGQAHDGSTTDGPNDWLAKKFDEMHDMYQGAQHKNSFQVRGYQKAAGVMRRTKWPIASGKDALKIKGIGQGMADRIDEWINGGVGRQYYENNEQIQTVQLFKDVYGVGRTRANEFYQKGARTIEDLKSGRFELTEGQRIGLALYEDLKQRIPREECKQIYDIVKREALVIDPKLDIEIMGSYRRGAENSGDVDFLITRNDGDGLNHSGVIERLVKRLMYMGVITHELSAPHDWKALEAKWMGVGRLNVHSLHRRIDILCIPFEQWGAALLYFTGNDIFNRSLRLYARKKGYSLNQRGLYKGVIRGKDGLKLTEGTIIASRTEQEIFDVLGVRWRAPQHRRP